MKYFIRQEAIEHKKLMILFNCSIILALLFTSCGGTPKVDWELSITGDISTPLTLSYAELAKMDQVELNDIMMEKSTGEDEVTSWSGVPLETLFSQAGVGDFSTITAVAGDGYAIEINKDELEGAIIAMKDRGEWIAEVMPDKGPIRLVTPKTPGNRWVFQLMEIQVNK
jgi:DMSO/TMAO reductase YedYZ molybdopterin-dependent catalytic subunit